MKPEDKKQAPSLVSGDGVVALELDKTDLPRRPEVELRDRKDLLQDGIQVRLELEPGFIKEALSVSLPERIQISSKATIVITDRIPAVHPGPGNAVILLAENSTQKIDFPTMQQRGIYGVFDPARGGLEELTRAVEMVSAGYVYLEQSTFTVLVESVKRSDRARREHEFGKLSRRELEVAELLANRMSNKEIARQLHIAQNTVKQHVVSAREKLGNLSDRHAVGEWFRSLQE